MADHNKLIEEEKKDQKFKNGPNNYMATSNNLIYH